MIKSHIGHIQFMVNSQNIPFYKELLTFLGWSVWYEDKGTLGVGIESGTSIWFSEKTKNVSNDYDSVGMNHLGLVVDSQKDVDDTVAFLQSHKINALFDTPRHRPEFSPDREKTYYQVMFETPDRLLFEVVYTGAKEK
jgi:catechol 2,3-dioxygenase-like lactoylglutathione lyase family enzyme